MTLESITVGIDPSSSAKAALLWATGLAQATGANVTALQSWEMPLIAHLPERFGPLPDVESMDKSTRDALEKVVSECGLEGKVEQLVVEGSPGEVLAAAESTDLIAVGRTGSGRRHGFARMAEIVLGSVARHIVHHAGSPSVVIPKNATWTDNPTVIVGVDGSPPSLKALNWAIESLPSARVLAVGAFLPWIYDPLAPVDGTMQDEVVDEHRKLVDHWIADAVAQAPEGVTIEPVAVVGSPRWALTDSDFGADIVVVGDRSRTGMRGRMLGSVTDHVVRNASAPVVVVPFI